jgi:hypothetical protein
MIAPSCKKLAENCCKILKNKNLPAKIKTNFHFGF